MSHRSGFFERSARWEYDQPVAATLLVLVPVALVLLVTYGFWFALVFTAIIPTRLWGLSEGGYIRRRYQRKYGWD